MAWRHGLTARKVELELTLTAVWEALFSAATWGGAIHTPSSTLLGRHAEVFATRPLTCYPTANGWNCTVLGGQPDLMVQFLGHDTILTYDGHRMKQLPPLKPRTELLWKFFDHYLAPAAGPVTILPPVPGEFHFQEEV
jgi:hypothetical protein